MGQATVLTIATLVRNEADRFLPSALEAWKQFSDRIVVLDDGSTDDTAELCEEAGCEVHRRESEMGMLGEEWLVRRAQWRLVRESPGWVMWLDADQVPTTDPRPWLKPPVSLFRVYDLWSPTEYREDAWWRGHIKCWWAAVHMPSLRPDFGDGDWSGRGVHAGHVPTNLPLPHHCLPHDCAMLHYAYSTPELREQKAEVYQRVAAHLTPQERFHAHTILSNARTKPLPLEPQWTLRLKASA